MTRTPVQITTATLYNDADVLVTIADDGSMWIGYLNSKDLTVQQWQPLADLPQS